MHSILCILLIILAAVIWLDGIKSNMVPCGSNCGETFSAIHSADNYRLYGMRFGLMEDLATAPEPESRPFLYTHNVNIGNIIFTAAEALGISSLTGKQLITLAAFLVGMVYVYLSVLLFTRSIVTALLTIVMLALDYAHVGSFGLNALRAWHWIGLFGPLFHVSRLCGLGGPSSRVLQSTALFATTIIAFSIGYDFFSIVFFCTFIAFFLLKPKADPRQSAILLATIFMCFCIPFIMRQFHVALALGADYWWRDFTYSFLIKVPLASKLIGPLDMADVDAFYSSWNVLRPPASPSNSIREVLLTFLVMVKNITIPEFGLISVVTVTLATVCSICYVGRHLLVIRNPLYFPLTSLLSLKDRFDSIFASATDVPFNLLDTSRMMCILVVGIMCGLAAFAPFSFHVYLKHQFPLIVTPLYIAKACLLTFMLWAGAQALKQRYRVLLNAFAGFLVIDFIVVTVATVHALQPLSTDWFTAIRQRSQSTFAVSWIPNSVSVLTDKWVIGVRPDLTRTFIERLKAGTKPFKAEDLFLFGERDAATRVDEYLSPDYWLYFPIDQTSPFDAVEPSCRRDWISRGLIKLFDWREPGFKTSVNTWVSHDPVAPGSLVVGGTSLMADFERVGSVELVGPRVLKSVGPDHEELFRSVDMALSPVRFRINCIHSTAMGPISVAPDAPEGYHVYALHLVSADGVRTVIGGLIFEVSNAAPKVIDQRAASFYLPSHQPTVSEILGSLDQLPIVNWGGGFVLFDLRTKLKLSTPSIK